MEKRNYPKLNQKLKSIKESNCNVKVTLRENEIYPQVVGKIVEFGADNLGKYGNLKLEQCIQTKERKDGKGLMFKENISYENIVNIESMPLSE